MSSSQAIAGLRYPTEYNLKELKLLDSSGNEVLDLKYYMVEINYFEDIFNNSVSGKVVISDAVGNFDAMQGYEKIKIEFVRGIGGESISGTYFVFSAGDRHYDIGSNFETYTINFCDEDLMMSERYRTCKAYRKSSISDIVNDVVKNTLKTPNKVDIESTMGLYDLVLPNKKIFETVNWLANYALPSGNGAGADMLFYENNKGYFFKSLQTLFKQTETDTYYYSGKNTNSEKDLNYNNIYRLEILTNHDTLNGVMKGTFANRLISFDPLIRKKYTKDFDYEQYFNSSQHLNDDKIVNLDDDQEGVYTDRFGKKLSDSPPDTFQTGAWRLMLSNTAQLNEEYIKENSQDSTLSDIFIERYMPNRIAQLEMGTYIKIKVLIPGNSELLVGNTIKINIHDTELEMGNRKTDDDILSGKYLITAARHMINTTRYTTVLELSKDTRIKNAGSW